MTDTKKINGKKLDDFKESYVLRSMFESIVANFYKMDESAIKSACENLDNLFSDLFGLPRASVVFDDKEHILDTKHIYMGKIKNIHSGLELIGRYFFEKRQQYQRICVKSDNQGDFDVDEFNKLKNVFGTTPITKKANYIPYSYGMKKYLTNYNKMDAVEFMMDYMTSSLSMMNFTRIGSSMKFIDSIKLSNNINRMYKSITKIRHNLHRAKDDVDAELLKREEELFLRYVEMILDGNSIENSKQKMPVLLCFHQNVWENLSDFQKRQVLEICNELISEMLKCELKEIRYTYGDNSCDFVNSEYLYVGDVNKDSPISMLQRIVYEYCFNKNYEMFGDDEEIKECKKIISNTGDYGKVKDYKFIKNVRKTAIGMQDKIYKYISKNLVIRGKKVKMPVSRDEFILDLYSSRGR